METRSNHVKVAKMEGESISKLRAKPKEWQQGRGQREKQRKFPSIVVAYFCALIEGETSRAKEAGLSGGVDGRGRGG